MMNQTMFLFVITTSTLRDDKGYVLAADPRRQTQTKESLTELTLFHRKDAEDAEFLLSLSPVFTCTPKPLVPKPLRATPNTHPCGLSSRLLPIASRLYLLIVTFSITTGSTGPSMGPVFTEPIFCTTSIPLTTLPKTECAPSRWGVGARVTKNWLPLVPGPAFAIEKTPAPSCFKAGWNSSPN